MGCIASKQHIESQASGHSRDADRRADSLVVNPHSDAFHSHSSSHLQSQVLTNHHSTHLTENQPSYILQSKFDQILQFFEIEPSENCFINIFNFLEALKDSKSTYKLSLKLTKVIFEMYDTDDNGKLDAEEIKSFYRDWKALIGKRNQLSSSEVDRLDTVSKEVTYDEFLNLGLIHDDVLTIQEKDGTSNKDDVQWEDEDIQDSHDISHDEMQKDVDQLKSSQISKRFLPVLEFFQIKPSRNLLKDMITLKQALFEEDASNYSSKRLQRRIVKRLLRFTFDYYDKDNSGSMSRDELVTFMEDVLDAIPQDEDDGIVSAEMMVDQFIRECDEDENGQIDYHEIQRHLPLIYQRMMLSQNDQEASR